MLLARKGCRVLLVDRVKFPADFIATHMVWPPGAAALKRWGIWEDVLATNPAICHVSLSDFPGGVIRSGWHPVDGVDFTFNVRRRKLDHALLRAAVRSGVEVREETLVEGVLFEDGRVVGLTLRDLPTGRRYEERAPLVIGADGKSSIIARAVEPETYNVYPSLTASYLLYAEGVDKDRDVDEVYTRPPYELLLLPTDDGLTVVNVVLSRHLLGDFRKDPERSFWAVWDQFPELAARARSGKPVSRLLGVVELPNFFRKPYGPGWALVGDAGHTRDPIRSQGMHNAFLDAELVADAVDDTFQGRQPFDDGMAAFQAERDRRNAFQYRTTISAAQFREPKPEALRPLLELVHNNPVAAAEFRGLVCGSMMPDEFNTKWGLTRPSK